MAGVKVGVAYVDVVPNMETFGAGIAAGVKGAAAAALPSIKSMFSGAMSNISGGLRQLKGVALGVLGGGAIFAGLDMLAKKSVAYGQAVERIVSTFGASKADATEFKAIVDATGGSADMVSKVLVRLEATFSKLGASSGAAAANLESYGLSQDLLSVKTHGLTGVMNNLADAYQKAGDKQAFIASTLGPRGMNMAPVLAQWNDLRKGVEALGLDWNKVAPGPEQMRGFEVMQIGLQATEVMIGTKVIPIVTKLGTALDNFLRDVAQGGNPIKAFFKDLVFGVHGLTGALIKLFVLIEGVKILTALGKIAMGFFGIGKAIAGLVTIAVGGGLPTAFASMELGLSGFMGVETAAIPVTAALALEFAVLAAAILDVVGLLYEYKLAQETKKFNAQADLADVRTAILQVGLDLKSGVAAGDAFKTMLSGLSMQQLAQLNAHPELLQMELNRLYEDGTISLADYTKYTMGLGKSQAQVDAEVKRMNAQLAAQAVAADKVTKSFKALWPQMNIGWKGMQLLSTATGQTATALKTTLVAAIKAMTDDGGKAFGDFIKTTEQAMKDWAAGLYQNFSSVTSNFDNLQKKSHQTMQYILADAVKEAKQQAQIAVDVAAIANRAGTNSAAVMQYMADHGITSVRELNAIVHASPAAFKAFQQAIKSSADSIQQGSLPILNIAHEQFMKLVADSGVLDKLKTVIHIDQDQLDATGTKLTHILNMLGHVGSGRYNLGGVDASGNPTGPGGGATGQYHPRTPGTGVHPPPGQQGRFGRMAAGGIVTSPTLALVGEAGPEAVIPLAKLRRGGQPFTVESVTVNWDEGVARIHGIAQDAVDEENSYQQSMQRMAR